MTKSHTIIIVY